MTPADNVFYFNNNIDVRLCLKNGYTTLKKAWVHCGPIEMKLSMADVIKSSNHQALNKTRNRTYVNALHRYNLAMLYQDMWDIPFRKDSYKVAIKRDPVARFISAISYLDSIKLDTTNSKVKKPYIDLTNVTYDDVESIIYAIETQSLRDEHFFSQTYFMGDKNQYDKVYDITELSKLLKLIQNNSAAGKTIEDFWYNKTKGTDKRIELTPQQELRVVKLYAKDYANGWC